MNDIRPWPVVKEGISLHPVETVQYLLRERGEDVAVDGVFGPQTVAAVRAFQTRLGLTVDGLVGPATWQALSAVQGEFHYRGIATNLTSGVVVDGIFGPATEGIVRGFQHGVDITVDGIVGSVTWRALVSGMLSV
jgi:peptidoglycan hydrolase-like protein with peptidoglycan-binding domain